MPSHLRRHLPVAAVPVLATLPCLVAYWLVNGRMFHLPPIVHFFGVTVAGLVAGAAAAGLSAVGSRRRDGRAVLLGVGFSIMAVLLIVHAVATPGVLMGDNPVVAFAGGLNVPAGAVVLAGSALPALRRPQRVAALIEAQIVAVSAILMLGGVLIAFPDIVPSPPPVGSSSAEILFVAGAFALLVLAWRAARTHRLTHRRSDLVVAVGAVWLAGALYGMLFLDMMDAGWWLAHLFEVGGVAMVGLPAALDLRASGASRPLVGDLAAAELVADEESFLGARVHALMVRLAEKDPSTEVHTRSVATLAVRIGEQLGLPAGSLRLLALGGLLHDMGKLSVPDRILRKPGPLTDEEFAVIRRHPVWGRELLVELGGFPPLVLELVEGHHERLDGRGYPDGRPAAELPLEVRILTVADVYDALTADRVYREAWTAERALGLLDEDSGSAFDPGCVAALRKVVAPSDGGPGWRLGIAPSPSAAPAARANVKGALKPGPA